MNLTSDALTAMTAIGQTRQHFRHLGIEVPADLAAELASIDAAVANAQSITFDPASLTTAIWDALEAGRDVYTDKEIGALLVRQRITEAASQERIEAVASRRRAEAIATHGAAIIDAMIPVVEDADEKLSAARDRIPNLDLVDQHFVTRLRPELMTIWGQAREALGRLERVTSLWTLVVNGARLVPTVDPRRQPLILAALDLEQLEALRDRHALAPVHAGHHLALAMPEDYIDRCQVLDEQFAERQAAHEASARTGVRVLA